MTTLDAAPAPPFCAARDRRFMLIAAILTSALGFIDGSVVSIALPAMRASLDATLAEAQWINNAYMLPLSALILVGGAAGDRFGVSRVLVAGLGLFLVASVLTALAPTAPTLIAGRALKGVGAALMVPGSLALIARAYPRDQRGWAIGVWAAASAVTTALGPILGGLVLETGADWAWRAIFAVNLPLGALAIWLLRTRTRNDVGREDATLDWPGAMLATLALGALAWALTRLGGQGDREMTLWLGVLGCLAAMAFLFRQARAPNPMMPLGLFRSRMFSAANIVTFALYFALSAVLFYQPMTVIAAWGVSEIAAAAGFAPLSVFIGGLSGPVGRLADRVGPRPLVAGGAALVALAFAGLGATAGLRAYWSTVLPLNALMGLGMAFVVGPLSTAVMAAAPDALLGAASGVNNAVSRIAGLVAVAVMGSLAALVYAAAGGALSFAEAGGDAAHLLATDRAWAAICWTTAALAALASAVAWVGLRDQSGA